MARSVGWLWVTASLFAGLAGCTPATEMLPACKLDLGGCNDELTVQFTGMDLGGTFDLRLEGTNGETVSFRCADVRYVSGSYNDGAALDRILTCRANAAVIGDFAPDKVTVTATWDGGARTEIFRPDYAILRPNGPECPPECRVGTVVLNLP